MRIEKVRIEKIIVEKVRIEKNLFAFANEN